MVVLKVEAVKIIYAVIYLIGHFVSSRKQYAELKPPVDWMPNGGCLIGIKGNFMELSRLK